MFAVTLSFPELRICQNLPDLSLNRFKEASSGWSWTFQTGGANPAVPTYCLAKYLQKTAWIGKKLAEETVGDPPMAFLIKLEVFLKFVFRNIFQCTHLSEPLDNPMGSNGESRISQMREPTPRGGGRGKGCQPIIWSIFLETVCKWKPRGGARSLCPHSTSTNGSYLRSDQICLGLS